MTTSWANQPTLITGASSGLGVSFAKALAKRKCPLIITARREENLRRLKEELITLGSPRVELLCQDLKDPEAPSKLKEFCLAQEFKVAGLINNAGLGVYGPFSGQSLEREAEIIDVNIRSVLKLTHEFLPLLREAKRGLILNVSSIAGFVSLPSIATYSASKAFVNSWSFALQRELEVTDPHIFVHTLCPGPTVSEFAQVASGDPNVKVSGKMDTDAVINGCLKAIDQGKHLYIPGMKNKIITLLPRFMSIQFQTWLARKMKSRPDARREK